MNITRGSCSNWDIKMVYEGQITCAPDEVEYSRFKISVSYFIQLLFWHFLDLGLAKPANQILCDLP